MKLPLLQRDLSAAHRTTAILLVLLLASIAANLVLALLSARLSQQERIVIIPPSVHKTFWVAHERVSREYLEQMGYFLMQLVLNVTPQSVDHQSRLLMQYAAPAAFGELRAQLAANAQRLKRDAAATVFSAHDLFVDEARMRVGVRGELTTFVSERRVSEVVKGYMIDLEYTAGRIYLKAFRETTAHDPLETKPAAGDTRARN